MATRNVRPFVHLRVMSAYSLGVGLSTPGEICRHARRVGFDAVALTDISGTYGFVEFHRAAREVGVKPIYGAMLYLDWSNPPSVEDPIQSVILLALDRTGLRNLCAAATLSATRRERGEGVFVEDLERRADGIVAVAGLDLGRPDLDLRHLLYPLREILADRLFVEYRDGLSEEDAATQTGFLADAREAGVAPLLVQDVRFVGPARPRLTGLFAGGDALPGQRVFGDVRVGATGPEHGMRTAADMASAYDEMPEAHANAARVAAIVQPDLFETLEEVPEPTSVVMLDAAAERRAALRNRIEGALRAREEGGRSADAAAVRGVVAAELERIERAGIEDRFLQYGEIVRRLRAAGVVVGPATGLSVQSRCAWLLGISRFDPYAVDERFDVDFEADGAGTRILDLQIAPEQRPRVLATLNSAYDDASIGYVPSVERVTAARALRVVSRGIDIPVDEMEEAVRIATRHPGMSLRELSEDSRSLGVLYRRSAAFRDLVAQAASIEGLPFGFARTKRTVVVSPRSLRRMFAYTTNPETGDHFIQSTRDSFPVGSISRIDIDALHVLAWVGADDAWRADDDAPYALVAAGDLEGVHVLEGKPGALAPSFGISSFRDLVHFVALLRHRGNVGLAARLSSFRERPAEVPAAKRVGEVVAETNGWVLFRDQARDILARLTGLDRPGASAFLSRFRDHSPGNLASLRREFLALTVETPVPLDDALAWFGRLLRLAAGAQDRQRVLAECLLIHRCLAFKLADRPTFFAHLLDHTVDADKRRRYRSLLEAEGNWLPEDVDRGGRRRDVEDGTHAPSPAPKPAAASPAVQLGLLFAETGEGGDRHAYAPSGRGTEKDGGSSQPGFRVVPALMEFYPHPRATPVELAGRIRNLHDYKSSSGKAVGFFELFDSSGFVRVFAPWERVVQVGEPLTDGSRVIVKGKVRLRDGRKVCDAMEIVVAEGGTGRGESPPDEP